MNSGKACTQLQVHSNAQYLTALTVPMECQPVKFSDCSCLDCIPPKPGWYFIKTNTSISQFENVGPSTVKGHKDIPGCIEFTKDLKNHGLDIISQSNGMRVVYNGEAESLRKRAKEHFFGKPGAYCLGIGDYPTWESNNWEFCFIKSPTKDKALRLYGEQLWRAVNGWPILCKR
ncbi:MAG: hypothetical protein ABIK91_07885 [Pseudomonadota bacterium]